jgi:hypothetical protein
MKLMPGFRLSCIPSSVPQEEVEQLTRPVALGAKGVDAKQ